MDIKTPRVIILEGPAGSGKSTLAHKLEVEEGFKIFENDFPRPRIYRGLEGRLLASLKDLDQAMAIQTTQQDLVIDRYLISQLVYGELTADLAQPLAAVGRQNYRELLLRHWLTMMVSLQVWNQHFSGAVGVTVPHLTWCFLIPTPPEIARRRNKTSKEYPYQIYDEYQTYLHYSSLLSGVFEKLQLPYNNRVKRFLTNDPVEAEDVLD